MQVFLLLKNLKSSVEQLSAPLISIKPPFQASFGSLRKIVALSGPASLNVHLGWAADLSLAPTERNYFWSIVRRFVEERRRNLLI